MNTTSSPAEITTLHLAHTNAHTSTLHIALYHSVPAPVLTNLKHHLLASNPTFNYAFINASLLISPTHLLAACFPAVHASEINKLRSRNVHSEILLCLSPNNSIKGALEVFGISAGDMGKLCVVKVGEPGVRGEMEGFLGREVQGVGVRFCGREMGRLTEWRAVRGVYKLGSIVPDKFLEDKGGDHGGQGEEMEQWEKDAEAVALGMMALRGS